MAGLREALEETYEAIDSADVPGVDVEEAAGAVEQPDPLAAEVEEGRERDEQGRFLAKPEAQEKPAPSPPATSQAKPTALTGQGQTGSAIPPGTALPVAPTFKAPQSWKPALREKFATLPPEVQSEVLRREKEVAQALQQSAEKAKGGEGWGEAIRPYEAQIRAAGVEPRQYVGDLLKTAHALTYAPVEQKAGTLADIIMQFGVPPEMLDKALVARISGRQAPIQQQPKEFRDPRFDKFLEEQNNQRAAVADETAGGFADTHEFFADVADEMATILDLWSAKGKKDVSEADLERAYNIACQNHEDVSSVLKQREAANAVRTTQVATQRARAAGSSLRSSPTAAQAAQPSGRRAVLEERFDELDR